MTTTSANDQTISDLPQTKPLDEHNRALVQHVHPADWVNPEPSGQYNMVVIGAGTAAQIKKGDKNAFTKHYPPRIC